MSNSTADGPDSQNGLHTENLFNSVEQQLRRQWENRNELTVSVPEPFFSLEGEEIKYVVTGWWNLYQEFSSAAEKRNRTRWQRSIADELPVLEISELADALRKIHSLIPVGPVQEFRPLSRREIIDLNMLAWTIDYYTTPEY